MVSHSVPAWKVYRWLAWRRLDGEVVVRGSMLGIYDFLTNSSGLTLSTLLAQDGGNLANAISVGDVYFAGANARRQPANPPKSTLRWSGV